MKLKIQILVATLLVLPGFLSGVLGQTSVSPKYSYLSNFAFTDTSQAKLNGPARVISMDGREGLNLTSIHSVLQLKEHTMKEKQGTLSMWVLSLEDLSTSAEKPTMKISNPYSKIYPFLSDCYNPQDFNRANFKLVWYNGWHPNLLAMFGKDPFYENAFYMPHKAFVSVSHFTFKKHKWYNLALSWDYDKDQYRLYINGVLVGCEDQFIAHKPHRDSISTSLYLGNPTLCYSDVRFYGANLGEKQIYTQFKKESTQYDQELEDELQHTYAGKDRKPFSWKIDQSWKQKMSIALTTPSDLDSFYVQGNPIKVAVTPEGLLVETINKEMTKTYLDSQVYVWSKKPFEGDLYVEYEYKSLRPGGLSLFLAQASGMNREDFMVDYPLRTSGRMTMIYGEDVRSYHWEYYREQPDMRNDLDNSAFMKQPYNFPLAFGTRNVPLTKNVWHKLQFLQIGSRLTGTIDGVIMFEYNDNGFINNGPVYDFGRIAIRCMLRSKMVFRNLKVYNREQIHTEKIFPGEPVRQTR